MHQKRFYVTGKDQEAQISKTFTTEEVETFSNLTLDKNPIHLDEEFCKKSNFEKPIVHGALVNGLVSAVMGTKLPGPGTIVAKQILSFPNPLYVGETVTAKVTVIENRKSLMKCSFKCVKSDGTIVLYGDAMLVVNK